MRDRNADAKVGNKYFKEDFGDKYIMDFPEDVNSLYDVLATAMTDSARTYVIEIKCYYKKDHPRPYTKFDNYQIDYSKIEALEQKAKEDNRIPILISYFSDEVIAWDISKVDWRSRKKTITTNFDDRFYGQRTEQSDQTYFDISEAVWHRPNKHPLI